MLALDSLHKLYIRPPKQERGSAGSEIIKPVPTGRAARMVRKLEKEGLPGGGSL